MKPSSIQTTFPLIVTNLLTVQVKPELKTMRPFLTFSAGGNKYYVHGSMMADKQLLRIFLGRPLKPAEK